METVFDIRHGFLRFFEKNEHKIYPSSSLIPHKDPSLMFTNAGMVPFKDIFLGKESPEDSRVTTCQKCVRAGGKHNDLDNVGYTKRHLTFFEMLGNFSFGDYFKERAIVYAWEFLTKELRLEKDRLYITVYHEDEEAFKIWKKITNFEDRKLIKIATKDNFWSMGEVGPCGPCSEIFYDQGSELKGGLPGTKEQDGDRFIEIWNLVFMQYEQLSSGAMKDLSRKSIDTGMGLERVAAIMQKVYDNFEIDLFKTIIGASEEITSTKAKGPAKISHRIIADHFRSSAFLIAEGIMPSNEGRGYVLRRILRRAIRHVNKLGYKDPMLYKLLPTLINEMGESYPELEKQNEFIKSILKAEEESFRTTIESGLKLLEVEVKKVSSGKLFPGDGAFKLHDTYGFPIDLTIDILKEQKLGVDIPEFDQCMLKQKQMARKAWAGSGEKAVEHLWFDIKEKIGNVDFVGYDNLEAKGEVMALVQDNQQVTSPNKDSEFFLIANQTPFFGESGGQAGDIGIIHKEDGAEIVVLNTMLPIPNLYIHKCKLKSGTIKVGDVIALAVDKQHRNDVRRNHTATHLLHAFLREKLGQSLVQKGSSVRHDRLRFDFSYHKAISRETLDEIEREINEFLLCNYEVQTKIMPYKESLKTKATALFGEKYDKDVRVVYVGCDIEDSEPPSVELCKGTHVSRLGEVGVIKILSEAAIAAGIRRIEAVSGHIAFKSLQASFNESREIAKLTQAEDGKIVDRVHDILEEQKKLAKNINETKQKSLVEALKQVHPSVVGNIQFFMDEVTDFELSDARVGVQQFLRDKKGGVLFLSQLKQGNLQYLIGVSSDLHELAGADKICKSLIETFHAKGGGNKLIAQGSLTYHPDIKEKIEAQIKKVLKTKIADL